MKYLTRHLIGFACALIILTVIFRGLLSHYIGAENWTAILLLAFAYGCAVFIAGWMFGKREYESIPLYDIGFRFHLTTYVICNVIAVLWLLGPYKAPQESLHQSYSMIIYWGLGLLLHFIFYIYSRRHAYKGINRSDLFD